MKKILSGILFLFIAFNSIAAAVSFKASLSSDVVEVGQRFTISFTINTTASNFVPPDLSSFKILSGPNQSRSTQYINGKMSSSVSLSYVLVAMEEGTYDIGPARVQVENEVMRSNPLQLKVVTASNNSANAQRNRQNQRRQEGQKVSDDVFIRCYVDKSNVYVGERITCTYKLYTSISIAENSLEELPALNGFWSQDVKSLYDQSNWEVEVINGKRYNVANLQISLLFPQRAGKLKVDPMVMKMQVQVAGSGGNSIFDRMFGSYETKEILVKSNEVEVNVKALPTKSKPKEFSGAVGEFDMQMTVNKSNVKANDAINLKIKISGKGNPQLLSAPDLDLPSDFEVYEAEIKDEFTTNATGISGSRTFDYLVIPRFEGSYELEAFNFTYFDPKSETYKSILSDKIKIEVAAGPETSNRTYSSINKEEVQLLNNDIRYIQDEELDLQNKNAGFYGSFLFYLLMGLPFLSFILLYLLKNKQKEKRKDVAGLRRSKAKKLAKKRLATAKKHLDNGDKTSFYEEISAALYGYFSDKFNFSLSELSKDKITNTLASRGSTIELVNMLYEVLNDAEMARFAPSPDINDQSIYEKATKVIVVTEEELS